jgi:hypothetical protein
MSGERRVELWNAMGRNPRPGLSLDATRRAASRARTRAPARYPLTFLTFVRIRTGQGASFTRKKRPTQ